MKDDFKLIKLDFAAPSLSFALFSFLSLCLCQSVSVKMSQRKAEEDEGQEGDELALLMSKLDMVSVLEKKEIFDSIMQSFPTTLGKAVSKKERDELGLKDSNLIYGEVTFESLGIVFEKIRKVFGRPYQGSSGPQGVLQSRGGIFYDLGSGTGKGVIGAAVLYNFDVCYGIECMEGLFSLSLDALNAYNTRGKARLAGRENDTRESTPLLSIPHTNRLCC